LKQILKDLTKWISTKFKLFREKRDCFVIENVRIRNHFGINQKFPSVLLNPIELLDFSLKLLMSLSGKSYKIIGQ
jgi:hypothetical protein